MDSFCLNQVEKVVFPAVGTGKLGYSTQGVANVMFEAIMSNGLGDSMPASRSAGLGFNSCQ